MNLYTVEVFNPENVKLHDTMLVSRDYSLGTYVVKGFIEHGWVCEALPPSDGSEPDRIRVYPELANYIHVSQKDDTIAFGVPKRKLLELQKALQTHVETPAHVAAQINQDLPKQ